MGLVQPNRSCTMKRQTYRTSSKAGRCQNAQIAVRAAYSMYSMVQVALVTSTAVLYLQRCSICSSDLSTAVLG